MGETILLVEDDAEIARIIRDTLRQQGYTVAWATTGREGWEDFQRAPYDLVLVDWMLPEMDGIALCRTIRLASDVPIIMISARKEDEDKVEGLDTGADDYLAKPFSLMELKPVSLHSSEGGGGITGNRSRRGNPDMKAGS